jgi:hypothetical protein
MGSMPIDRLFDDHGLATTQGLLAVMSEKMVASHVRVGTIVRVWHGVYALSPPDLLGRLAALDLATGKKMVACMNTAACLYDFDTEPDERVHVLDPGVRMRPSPQLMVHQRVGAPLKRIQGRLATAPAWTAVELGRTLRRPRALAVLDAALHSGCCTRDDLAATIREQKGRRGIVKMRELAQYADGRAESPMESEARLVFIDGGLPMPELQYEIIDRYGKLWRVDFAWPDAMLVAEYDSVEWHANPDAFKHDRLKRARLQECGWFSDSMTVDDIRRYPIELAARLRSHLERSLLTA